MKPIPMPAARSQMNGRIAIAVILIGGLIVIAASAISYLIFLLLAMLPAATASFLERPGQRQATTSVGTLTMATVIPLILGAIATGSDRDLLRSSTAWTFVAAGAVIGIGIYFALPMIAVWMEDMRASTRLRKMRERQTQLVNDWGAEVTGR